MSAARVCLAVLCCVVAPGYAWPQGPVDPIFADGFEGAGLVNLDPGLLVVIDNSGSMNGVTPANSCGLFPATRFNAVKCGVQQAINGFGDAMFGLTRFATNCTGAGNCTTSALAACSATASGDLLTGVGEGTQAGAVAWVDGAGNGCQSSCAAPELLVPATALATPLAGALLHAKDYFESASGPINADRITYPRRDRCRRYAVVLITDGEETCAGDPVAAATALRQTTVAGDTYDLPTYAIGIGMTAPNFSLESIALAGGTDASGARRAYYANNEAELLPHFGEIVREVKARSGCPCVFRGEETCNGLDDDCNGLVDDGVTPPPSFACLSEGACAGVVPRVCDGRLDKWVCDYGPAVETDGQGNVIPETRCDGLDNDCDGVVDWSSEGADVCAACSPAEEVCDGRDNDCDGSVDEPKSAPDSHPSYVVEPLVQLSLNVYVSAYEASRPDATATSAGFLDSRACARPGVLPWSGATYAEAAASCQAAGLRLCTEAEWQMACRGSAGNCTWSTSTTCTTYGPARCNGEDFDPVPGLPDDDRVVLTADMVECYAQHAGGISGRIFDLSGNLKEWTVARAPGVSALRGGSYTEPRGGLTCLFNAVTAGGAWNADNAGFRCCSSTPP